MATIDFVFFDAGGGHRSSAVALCEAIRRQGLPWQTRMVNLQEVLDPIDILRRTIGIRIADQYNALLNRGWTLGARHLLKVLQATIWVYHRQEVRLLREHWQKTGPDLVVSLVPHFNRALCESLPERPFVTIITDLADYPPHFWLERQEQFVICGSQKAVEQARGMGISETMILRSSGMVVHPRFYDAVPLDRAAERRRLGLDPGLPTGLVLFGGQGSKSMLEIARQMEQSAGPQARERLAVQFIYICGKNLPLADQLRALPSSFPRYVEGFTNEVPYYMQLADFFIGKPGPGSISEALLMKLPVILEENAWTLPQERYNAQWVRENQLGVVVRNFRQIAPAIRELLQEEQLARFRSRAAALNNRAVLEIPGMLQAILEKSASRNGTYALQEGTSSVSASGTTLMSQGS